MITIPKIHLPVLKDALKVTAQIFGVGVAIAALAIGTAAGIIKMALLFGPLALIPCFILIIFIATVSIAYFHFLPTYLEHQRKMWRNLGGATEL